MFDAKQLIDQFLGGSANNGAASGSTGRGLAGGALAGGLAGLLVGTKTGRKIGKSALTYGGTALLGGLAYKAWQDWQQGKQAVGPADNLTEIPEAPADSAFIPQANDEAIFNRALLLAMINAAKADGHIDDLEQQRIMQHLEQTGISAADRDFVSQQLAGPLDMEAVVAAATCTETAAELYAASLIAIDPTGAAEQGYLGMLAARLNLPADLASHLQANMAAAKSSANTTG
jgi:uncharacterized membrane protein YebE (DUF533 family)